MSIYTVSSQSIYDNISQNYKNIYVVDRQPSGVFSTIARRIHPPKLSPFNVHTNTDCHHHCIYAIYNPHHPQNLLCMEDLGLLFSFLVSNRYSIDTSLTSMMNKSTVQFTKNFVCFVRKE